jgi:hypothetical protein
VPQSKQLHVTTESVPAAPDHAILTLRYGRTGPLGVLTLHSEDFADFLQGLRAGFEEVIVRPATLAPKEKTL